MTAPFKIDFVGIGASKSGTTWLGHMLDAHFQVCMSEPKEVHFFNDRLTFRNSVMKRNYAKGISWFKKHFNHCPVNTLKGEITPRYSTDPVTAKRIYDHNHEIKIFYCLRNPVDRIESHYNFAKYFSGREDRPMDQAVREEPDYIDMSLYFRNLSYFLNHFSKEQIFIVWFEDIKSRPEALLEEVYTFLGVDPSVRPSTMHQKSNPARRSKLPWVQKFIRKMNYKLTALGLVRIIDRLKKAGMGKWVVKINSNPIHKDIMPQDLKAYILERVGEDIRQLENWSERDLSHWLK